MGSVGGWVQLVDVTREGGKSNPLRHALGERQIIHYITIIHPLKSVNPGIKHIITVTGVTHSRVKQVNEWYGATISSCLMLLVANIQNTTERRKKNTVTNPLFDNRKV